MGEVTGEGVRTAAAEADRAPALLRIRDLHAGYATASVLRGIDLEVGAGEVVALLGRNGMGKTTLLRAISGARPPVCTEGSVSLRGEELLTLPVWEVARRGVGAVPQGRRVFASLTVEENLRIVTRTGHGHGWTPDRVYELFPRLGERRRQRGGTLSGGEQQMLAIGRALVTNPSLLVMDEPSEGLAQSVLTIIQERLAELSRGSGSGPDGLGVLLAEQNLDLALALASRIYVLGEDGQITWTGTPDQLRDNDTVLHSHLGVGEDDEDAPDAEPAADGDSGTSADSGTSGSSGTGGGANADTEVDQAP